ncbi:DUF4652 domain-containing protein [Clostridium aciditolerans]|uniref:DUF4652 domain-containing protein n=1 Tax=Clostridium aciditolerans TaxID=339861 RepID=A0A934M773_9CLOT|nr:DUF4652 domain-containing protein [Clostridium aciditolerans]MBI6875383.1 DUF4652 domain-containing protein [Clostridium aciditolerans]
MKNLKIKICVLCSVSVILAFGLTACSNKQDKSAVVNNETPVQQNNNNQKPNDSQNNSKETKNNANTITTQNANVPKIVKQQASKETKINFNTPWVTSSNGNNAACIEGRGAEALEEGVGKIFVKNNNGNIFSFEIADNQKISPRYIEWVDNENLMVIIGSAHGTVSKGGNLYLLNVTTGKLSLIFETPDKKQQIMSTKTNGNNINLKVNVYDDDNYNKSHIEDWTIYSFDISLNKQMEVKSSTGKLIYTINGANQ